MLDQVLQLFEIVPDYDLDIMAPNQDLFGVTNKALLGLEQVLKKEKPDLVLAQGDTTTVFVAALASFYLKIPFGHVEAGLRTYNKRHPFPEEINRQLASRMADLHFAPTEQSKQNLLQEGVDPATVHVTGNTVIDALFYTKNLMSSGVDISPTGYQPSAGKRLILLTAHRRENFGDGMENICRAVLRVVKENPDVELVYPVHLNPNVQDPVNQYLAGQERIHLIKPLDYAPFVALMDSSTLILTDSGGVQEEAPSLGKPVLVLRETTERPEAVEAGTVKLVGTDVDKIVWEANRLLQDSNAYNAMTMAHNPYGDGHASERIVEVCERFLGA